MIVWTASDTTALSRICAMHETTRLERPAIAPVVQRLHARSALRAVARGGSVSAPLADAIWTQAVQSEGLELVLSIAGGLRPSTYGLLTYLLAASDNVGMALRRLTRHYRLLSTAAEYELAASARQCAVECRVFGSPTPSRDAFGIAAVVGFVRGEVDGMPTPREACLRAPAPSASKRREWDAFFGVRVRFGASTNRVVYSRRAMATPMRGADSELGALLEEQAQQRGSAATPWAQRVRERIAVTPSRPPTVTEIATELDTSPRSLRRHLAVEGEPFQSIVDNLRQHQAEALLAEGTPTADVAVATGFCDPTAFRRAFRRWTGVSPARYARALNRLEPSPSA